MVLPEGLTLEVCWLLHNNGECPVLQHLLELHSQDVAFFASAADVIRKLQQGKYHKRPWTRDLEGKDAKGIFEARAMGGPNRLMARYPFIYSPKRQVILLYGFTKTDGKPPPKFVAKAAIYKELIEKGDLSYEQIDLSIFPR